MLGSSVCDLRVGCVWCSKSSLLIAFSDEYCFSPTSIGGPLASSRGALALTPLIADCAHGGSGSWVPIHTANTHGAFDLFWLRLTLCYLYIPKDTSSRHSKTLSPFRLGTHSLPYFFLLAHSVPFLATHSLFPIRVFFHVFLLAAVCARGPGVQQVHGAALFPQPGC